MTRHTKKIVADIRATQDGNGASSQNDAVVLSVSDMNRYTKQSILIGVAFLAFAIAPHVLADTTQGFTALAPITGLTDQAPTTGGLATFFNNLYKYLIGVAAIFAVIEIIWGGLEISTQDSVSKQSAGRERIQEAILGLVLVLSPVLVFSIINPSILNLSLNLPAIKGSAPVANPNNTPPSPKVDTSQLPNGVTQKVTGTYLQKATFSSANPELNNQARNDWINSCSSANQVPISVQSSDCISKTAGAGQSCDRASDAIALCEKGAGPFYFLDDAGLLNRVVGNLYLVPANPTADLSKSFLNFYSTCTTDGGNVCIAADTVFGANGCATGVTLSGNAAGACYQAALFCFSANSVTTGLTAVGTCSSKATLTGT